MEPLKNFKQGIDMISFVILKLEQQCLAKIKEREEKNRTQSGACYNNPGENWWGFRINTTEFRDYLDIGVGGKKGRESLDYLPTQWLK